MGIHLSKSLKFAALVMTAVLYQPAHSLGAPVFDMANLIESGRQTLQQIEQYKTQLNQYDNMLKNSKSLDKFTWDKANNTINELVSSIDTLKQYKQQLGSTNEYLARYQTVDDYRQSACFNGGTCTQVDMQALRDKQTHAIGCSPAGDIAETGTGSGGPNGRFTGGKPTGECRDESTDSNSRLVGSAAKCGGHASGCYR